MALVIAYDTRTGEPTPHPVPTHWIGHPVLGPHLTREPLLSEPEPTPEPSITTPEADDSADTEEE